MRFTITALILAAACPLAAQTFDPKMPAAVPPVAGTPVEAASLRYIDVKTGGGAAAVAGQEYTVHYTGWLRDGTKFDSSVGKDPLKFIQGRRAVIAGWEMGFEGMKVGGQRRLFIPYQLAYGEAGRGSIPPKAELVFDVELLDVKAAPDAPPAAAEALFSLAELEAHTIALAKAIPEDKYSWRPSPGVRSFREVFLHVVFGNELILKIASGAEQGEQMKELETKGARESAGSSKEDVVASLVESFAAARKQMEAAQARDLAREVDFFGTKTTRRAMLGWFDTHAGEHLGQLIAYARVNGIVPPWSQPQAK
jgi:peptidylprolyl isomerase